MRDYIARKIFLKKDKRGRGKEGEPEGISGGGR